MSMLGGSHIWISEAARCGSCPIYLIAPSLLSLHGPATHEPTVIWHMIWVENISYMHGHGHWLGQYSISTNEFKTVGMFDFIRSQSDLKIYIGIPSIYSQWGVSDHSAYCWNLFCLKFSKAVFTTVIVVLREWTLSFGSLVKGLQQVKISQRNSHPVER